MGRRGLRGKRSGRGSDILLPLRRGRFRGGPIRLAEAQPGLLGPGSSVHARPGESRRDPHGVLRRRSRAVRGFQGRGTELEPGIQRREMGQPVRFPGDRPRRRDQVGHPAPAAFWNHRIRHELPPRTVRGLARARRANPRLQLRVRQSDPDRRRAAANLLLLLEFRSRNARWPGRGAGAGVPRALR